MRCEQADRRLTAWMDGELSEEEAESVRAHVAQCENCARQIAEYRAVKQSAQSGHTGPALAHTVGQEAVFWTGLQQRIQAEEWAETMRDMKQMRKAIDALQAEVAALREQISRQNQTKPPSPKTLLPTGALLSPSSNLHSLL